MNPTPWAEPRSFSAAWAELTRVLKHHPDENHRIVARGGLRNMAEARLVLADRAQVDALPRLYASDPDGLRRYALQMKLPLDPMYLDLDSAIGIQTTDAALHLRGVLLSTKLDGKHGIGASVFGYQSALPGCWYMGWCAFTAEIGFSGRPALDIPEEDRPEALSEIAYSLERALAVIDLLNAANVYLDGLPMRRKAAERAERKGQRIPLVVRISEPQKRPVPRGGTRDFRYRFERMGHYRHITTGPHAKPEAMAWCPEHGRCRREWVRPHVVGPADKPLVPKVRSLA